MFVVSAADENYWFLLRGLICSLKDRGLNDIGVIDIGLAPASRSWLEARAVQVVDAKWMVDFPGRTDVPDFMKSMTSKPFLPRLFPGHEIICWIDSDAWLQDEFAIEYLRRGAELNAIAIVPEIDRAYRITLEGSKYRRTWRNLYGQIFPDFIPPDRDVPAVLNSGVFAMRSTSPVWQLWADQLQSLGERTRFFLAEQSALNVAIYSSKPNVALLPATCNWLTFAELPRLDSSLFVSPAIPHEKIGVLHIAGKGDKMEERNLATVDGKIVRRRLLYRNGDY